MNAVSAITSPVHPQPNAQLRGADKKQIHKASANKVPEQALLGAILQPRTLNSIPVESVIVDYDFNGDAKDLSDNHHDCTVYGATLTVGKDGIPDSAYHFNGAAYLDCGNVAPAKDIRTIETWVKFDQFTGFFLLANIISVGKRKSSTTH